MSNLAVRNGGNLAIAPSEGQLAQERLQTLHSQRSLLLRYIKSQMVEDRDYGIIPGTKDKTLLKPGAEKLATLFNLAVQTRVVEQHMDWDARIFYFKSRCSVLNRAGEPICEVEASANTKESKFNRTITVSEKKATEEQKQIGKLVEMQGKYGPYKAYKIDDPNGPFNNIDNVMAIAQKRSFVRAINMACNASEIFKNLEDIELETADSGVSRSELIAENDQLLEAKGWTATQGRTYLQQTFGQQSRRSLTIPQLQQFNGYLERLPNPAPTQATPKPNSSAIAQEVQGWLDRAKQEGIPVTEIQIDDLPEDFSQFTRNQVGLLRDRINSLIDAKLQGQPIEAEVA